MGKAHFNFKLKKVTFADLASLKSTYELQLVFIQNSNFINPKLKMLASDEAIVHAIINPNEPFVSTAERERTVLQHQEELNRTKPLSDKSELLLKLADLERRAIRMAESGRLQ